MPLFLQRWQSQNGSTAVQVLPQEAQLPAAGVVADFPKGQGFILSASSALQKLFYTWKSHPWQDGGIGWVLRALQPKPLWILWDDSMTRWAEAVDYMDRLNSLTANTNVFWNQIQHIKIQVIHMPQKEDELPQIP